jgi:hypothetical protein
MKGRRQREPTTEDPFLESTNKFMRVVMAGLLMALLLAVDWTTNLRGFVILTELSAPLSATFPKKPLNLSFAASVAYLL